MGEGLWPPRLLTGVAGGDPLGDGGLQAGDPVGETDRDSGRDLLGGGEGVGFTLRPLLSTAIIRVGGPFSSEGVLLRLDWEGSLRLLAGLVLRAEVLPESDMK